MFFVTMTATFKLNGDELNESFLNKLRQMFAKKDIEVVVFEAEMDETERIRANPALHERLLQAKQRTDNREGLIAVDLNSFE